MKPTTRNKVTTRLQRAAGAHQRQPLKPQASMRSDLTYTGRNGRSNIYTVSEQLYPESRGFTEHDFTSEEAAMAFINNAQRN